MGSIVARNGTNDPCRMADNKNQHFVPKAHLKAFSVRGEGRAIHLFNLDRAQIFRDAPVKNQCARDYFYGQDARLERAIQLVEGGYAQCISSLREPRTLVGDLHVTILRRFAYLQHLRTEAAAQRSAELTFAVTDVRGADIEQPTFKEAVRSGVIAAMRHYAETMNFVDDLKVRIVRNRTSDPFITSDDPAVLANRWHQQDTRALHRSFGIVSAGAVLFLPLSPTLLAILFDGDVYSAENSGGMDRCFRSCRHCCVQLPPDSKLCREPVLWRGECDKLCPIDSRRCRAFASA
jgi:hypothetical protein